MRYQRGNVFIVLLAAASMIGLVSWGLYNLMASPLSTINAINKKTLAETQILMTAELLATEAINNSDQGDCDGDNYIEPPAWRAGTGPTNGGVVPNTTGGSLVDPWGTQYGYCVWDMGTVMDDGDGSAADNDCGTTGPTRLNGSNDATTGDIDTNLVMAIVSAGPNATFGSSCSDYVDGTTAVFDPDDADDIYKTFTYGEAAMLSAGGSASSLWYLDTITPDPDKILIDKNLEIGSDISISTGGDGVFAQVTADELTTIDTTGRVILTNDDTLSAASACNDSSDLGNLRYKNDVGTKDVQVCMDHLDLTAPNIVINWQTVGTVSNLIATCPEGVWYIATFNSRRDICHTNYFTIYLTSGGTSYSSATAPTNAKARLVFSPRNAAGNQGMFRAAYHTDGTEAELSSANIGSTSLAIGRGARATSNYSYALGSQESTAGSTVLGVARTGPRAATSATTYAIGVGATSTGVNSMALGEATSATALNCQALGLGASCSNSNTKAIGESASASSAGAISIGYNGTATNTDAITLTPNGAASGSSTASDMYMGGSGIQVIIGAGTTAATDALVVVTDQDANGSEEFKVYRATAANWTAISDGRLKDVLGTYDKGLKEILQIQPRYFYFKPGNISGMSPHIQHLGFIAQEIKPWFPEAITYQENGYMSIDPNPIFLARVNAYKDLKKESDRLQDEIVELEAKLSSLEKEAYALPTRKPEKPDFGFLLVIPAAAAGLMLRRQRVKS